jgi:hypothetical protein
MRAISIHQTGRRHVYNFSQLICDVRHADLTRLLGMKVEIHQLPTLPTSFWQTSSSTNGGPLAPSGSFPQEVNILHMTGRLHQDHEVVSRPCEICDWLLNPSLRDTTSK